MKSKIDEVEMLSESKMDKMLSNGLKSEDKELDLKMMESVTGGDSGILISCVYRCAVAGCTYKKSTSFYCGRNTNEFTCEVPGHSQMGKGFVLDEYHETAYD